MQTSDPNILAAGDCVESINVVTGKPSLFPMGSAANKQGRAAGANAMGRSIVVRGFAGTVIVKVFDLAVAKTGLSENEAGSKGFSSLVTYVLAEDHAGYYPGAKALQIKTIADRSTGRLLGAQVIGEKGVDKRIDVMATAIYNRMALEDLLQLDLAYAPPYSAARDPVIVAGAIGQNFYVGDWNPVTPAELHHKIERGDDFVLVDTRTVRELKRTGVIPGAIHIPIDDLRDRISDLYQEKETILYCAVGLRSYIGNRLLAMKGFKSVKTLTGGIFSWTYPRERYP
jgi:rhodanese-related sulfurtransferase